MLMLLLRHGDESALGRDHGRLQRLGLRTLVVLVHQLAHVASVAAPSEKAIVARDDAERRGDEVLQVTETMAHQTQRRATNAPQTGAAAGLFFGGDWQRRAHFNFLSLGAPRDGNKLPANRML